METKAQVIIFTGTSRTGFKMTAGRRRSKRCGRSRTCTCARVCWYCGEFDPLFWHIERTSVVPGSKQHARDEKSRYTFLGAIGKSVYQVLQNMMTPILKDQPLDDIISVLKAHYVKHCGTNTCVYN